MPSEIYFPFFPRHICPHIRHLQGGFGQQFPVNHLLKKVSQSISLLG
jgi:hypothetical protein